VSATLAERAAAVLLARGIVPPKHRSPEPYFDASGWRWLPHFKTREYTHDCRAGWLGWVLDLDDDGNKGRLLGVVRDVYGAQWLTAQALMTAGGVHGWRVSGIDGGGGATEVEALVAALERAP